MPLHLTKRLRLFEVADYWCISCESWRWLKVFIVSFNHAFQLKIPLVIIFKLAYVAVESWTKYVSYFLSHMAPSYPSMTCPLTQPINQCCSLACWGRNQTSTLYFFCWGGGGGPPRGQRHACSCQANSHFTGFSTGLTLWKMPVHRFWDFLPHKQKHCCTEDCWNVNK